MNQVAFKLKDIYANAKYRPQGYVEDVLSHGRIEGEYLLLTENAARALVEKYREKNPIDGLPSDPAVWGPVLWGELHNRTKKDLLSTEEEIRWVSIFTQWIPCGKCKAHFLDILRNNPPDMSSQHAYEQWAIDVHNLVNKSLGKPMYSNTIPVDEHTN